MVLHRMYSSVVHTVFAHYDMVLYSVLWCCMVQLVQYDIVQHGTWYIVWCGLLHSVVWYS